ncbi:unnamed protein product [Lactuca saligna]|uniref:Uncharacterized protein n=1 Tax=Lactuca saligna TaxID=75948 RepID=A0AA36EAG7_LACSI|nr:unnamed protein product [Lactuca saligna]
MLLKKKALEILPEEKSTWHDEKFQALSPKITIYFNRNRDSYLNIKFIKPTNSFTPPLNLTKENEDIHVPPNGMKFNLWPSVIYLVDPCVDIEERASTNEAYADALWFLRQYVLDIVIDFGFDWEIRYLGENEVEEPDLELNVEKESLGNILKRPHRGLVFSSKGQLRFMIISQKHLFSSEFIQGIIGLLKRTRDQDNSLRVKIIQVLTWFLSFQQWLIYLRNKV